MPLLRQLMVCNVVWGNGTEEQKMEKRLLTMSLKLRGKARVVTKYTTTSKTALFRATNANKVNNQHSLSA